MGKRRNERQTIEREEYKIDVRYQNRTEITLGCEEKNAIKGYFILNYTKIILCKTKSEPKSAFKNMYKETYFERKATPFPRITAQTAKIIPRTIHLISFPSSENSTLIHTMIIQFFSLFVKKRSKEKARSL